MELGPRSIHGERPCQDRYVTVGENAIWSPQFAIYSHAACVAKSLASPIHLQPVSTVADTEPSLKQQLPSH